MTYQESLDWLFSQLPMYQRIGKAAYKADLSNTLWLMDRLGNPEQKFNTIHVAGTNGKGSTSHLLASIFQEAGYKTGLYTSPHLIDFRERVRINGEMIPETNVTNFIDQYKDEFLLKGISFFEWTVALAFNHFANEKVDIAIVEVGMGGRLDSTNVIMPELSIITNIGHDHAQFLGNTLEKIATEKAGIIKPNTPVLIGKRQPETEAVFHDLAKANNSEIYFADEFDYRQLTSPLKGSYQWENFKTVQAAIDLLKNEWKINPFHLKDGFKNVIKNTQLRGRWEVLSDNPLIICDVGHNKEGLSFNLEQLSKINEKFIFLLGFVSDKNVKEILTLFPSNTKFIFTEPNIPRALNINELKSIGDELNLDYDLVLSVKQGIESYRETYANDHSLYVGGSTFMVSDLLKVWS